MADTTRQANVMRFTADAQTFTGPVKIIGIKFNNGANAQTITIKDAAANAIYAVQAGANVQQPVDCFGGAGWQLRSEQYTVAFSSTGGTLYVYLG